MNTLPTVISPLWPDYVRFHQLSLETWDVDPVYPVLAEVSRLLRLTPEDRYKLIFRHVAFYHIGSALAFFAKGDDRLPCGTERRGNRDPKQRTRHLAGLRDIEDSPGGWTRWVSEALINEDRRGSWGKLVEKLTTIPGNGRWAAYKTAEMLWKVCGVPLEATDMSHEYSSGPRKGLELLYPDCPRGNSKQDVQRLDELSTGLCESLSGQGCSASVESVETTLCDFHSLYMGRYYVGHDIDQMLRQLLDVPSELTTAAFQARRLTLPSEYLGEYQGWAHVDKARCRVYMYRREIITRGSDS